MAVVQLSDVVVPEFYATYGGFDSMTSTALYQSGILQQNPLLDAHVAGPGQIAFLPMWSDLAAANDAGGSEPNIGTDKPADVATTKKISAVNMQVRKSMESLPGFQTRVREYRKVGKHRQPRGGDRR